jgi:hypothetical protein
MPYFDEMATALAEYPVTDVTLEVVEVVVPGAALNVNEVASFRVRVSNNGPLNLSNVTVRIKAQNGALVANNGAISPFVSEFVTQALPTIGNKSSQLTVGSPLKVKAPPGAQASKTLVKATLEGWDADLNNILNGRSDPLDNPSGTYAAAVVIS